MSSEQENRAKVDSLLGQLGITREQKDQIAEKVGDRLTGALARELEPHGITVTGPTGTGRLRRWFAARRRAR